MELILARDPKNNRREFYRYIAQKKKKDQGECKVSMPLLMDERGEHVTTDMENTEYSWTWIDIQCASEKRSEHSQCLQ